MWTLLVILALAVALKAGVFGEHRRASLRRAIRPALMLGGIGFAAGFFGPIIFAPEANQGPLLGIFVTGPGGFALGLLYGIIREVMPAR